MAFIKTVNLWDPAIARQIEDGTLVLQTGQWVTCGSDGVKSRFIGFNPKSKTYDVVHGATIEEVNRRFAERIKFRRLAHKRYHDMRALAA